jgi:hypothetical protein
VRTPAEFKLELKNLISNPEHRARQLVLQRKAVDYAFSNQGHASEAIMDLISQRFCSSCGRLPTEGVHLV